MKTYSSSKRTESCSTGYNRISSTVIRIQSLVGTQDTFLFTAIISKVFLWYFLRAALLYLIFLFSPFLFGGESKEKWVVIQFFVRLPGSFDSDDGRNVVSSRLPKHSAVVRITAYLYTRALMEQTHESLAAGICVLKRPLCPTPQFGSDVIACLLFSPRFLFVCLLCQK